MLSDDVISELDVVREGARRAFAARALEDFMSAFSPQLQYTQPNGKTIGRDQLARDVRKQFSTMRRFDANFVRVGIKASADSAVETLIQHAWMDVAIFWVFTKRWHIKRTGEYHWERTRAGWKIVRVIVLEELVSGRPIAGNAPSDVT